MGTEGLRRPYPWLIGNNNSGSRKHETSNGKGIHHRLLSGFLLAWFRVLVISVIVALAARHVVGTETGWQEFPGTRFRFRRSNTRDSKKRRCALARFRRHRPKAIAVPLESDQMTREPGSGTAPISTTSPANLRYPVFLVLRWLP